MEAGIFRLLDTEPVNPLYTGQYAVGPYIANQVAPSGSDVQWVSNDLMSELPDCDWQKPDDRAARQVSATPQQMEPSCSRGHGRAGLVDGNACAPMVMLPGQRLP